MARCPGAGGHPLGVRHDPRTRLRTARRGTLVLLHGGGATSTVWFANVGELSRTHRVHAVDIIGGAGRSVHHGRPTRTLADLIELTYRLRAVPLMARPTADRMRGFIIRWETGDLAVNPAWLNLIALTAEFPESKIVMPRRPEAEQLAASTVPTLVLLAEKSRSHDIRRVAANARRLMPGAAITILPGVSHHSVPTENPATLNRELLEFLA